MFHSFWYGDGEDIFDELVTVYYKEKSLRDLLHKEIDIETFVHYTEIETDDSFYVILRNKKD